MDEPTNAPTTALSRGNSDSFLVDLGRVRRDRPRRHAAHVLVVGHGGAERNGPPAGEDRHDERDVRQVGPAVVGVVHDVDVALAHRSHRELLDHRPHHRNEGRDVDGNGCRLRERLAFEREQARRSVESFLDDGRERRRWARTNFGPAWIASRSRCRRACCARLRGRWDRRRGSSLMSRLLLWFLSMSSIRRLWLQ